jgi:hypothetical protein
MKAKVFILTQFLCLLFIQTAVSQNFIPGKLYVKVADNNGIPVIIISATDTTITMSNTELRTLFQQNHVSKFERAFPYLESMKIRDRYGLKDVYQLTCNCDENQLMDEILSVSGQIYSYVEKIPIDKMAYTPDDYNLQDQNPVSGPDSALNFINAEKAWEYTKGDTAIHVGITDFKILRPWSHEDIQSKIIYWDTINGARMNFHGLFVSGCVAANTDNGVGKSGIGFNITIMFSSHYGSEANGINAILNLVEQGVKVMNFSWGHPENPDSTFQIVINTLNDNGVLVVAAAGNDYDSVYGFGYQFYPASYKNVLSVASIDYDYHFVTWDTNIAYQHHNYNDSVDICAPGYHVMGLWDSCYNCYKRSSGSSFASPIVAGTAALIFSINPCLSPATVTQILKSTANDTIYEISDNNPFHDKLGTGALDAGKALELTDRLYRPRNYSITDGQDTIWRDNVYVDSILTIEHGGQLTITGTVFLNPKARISVHCGGKLVLDGGKLTTNCSCSLWDGIELWGNSDESQYTDEAQGTVELKNEGIIENARIGVKVFGDPYRSQVYPSGGILYASNTTFRNNETAVRFYPYENYNPITHAVMNNVSGFTSCTFETTQELNDTISIPLDMVYFDAIRGVHFAGCTFQNTRENSVKKESRGNGIFSIGSSFWVDRICLAYNQNECIREQRSKFSKLNYGIKALGTDAEKLVSVDRSVFTSNYTGIYLANIENAIVTRDTFYVRPAYYSSSDTVGGLYLNECHNYTVEENYLYSGYSPGGFQTSKSVGIAVNNSNLGVYLNTDNQIYNNRFEKLNYGILPMNKNRNTDGDNGLEIRCNDFIYPNEYDVAVTLYPPASQMGIKNSQGTDGTSSTTEPAGNTFSYTWQNLYSDYYNDGENFDYWYHFHNGGCNVEPINHSPDVYPQTITNVTWSYSKNQSCPSSFLPGGGPGREDLISQKNSAKSAIDSIGNLLDLLVDGGDTPGTNTYVQLSTPDQTLEVRDDLLSKTPFLSDSVMITAAAKENVLPAAVITEILSANPQAAKSDTVIRILENRINPLTEYQLATIGEGLYVIGAKESLETKLAGYRSLYNTALKRIIQYYKNDTLNMAAPDSVIWYLNAENQLWAKYSLAFEYLATGDTMSAENTLNAIPNTFQLNASQLNEHDHYFSYIDLLKQLKREGKSVCEADSNQIQIISNLMNSSTGSLSGYARNVLLALGEIAYTEPYIFPQGSVKSSKIHHKSTSESKNTNLLKVYPNPARDYFIIEYSMNIKPDNASVVLYDAMGKIIRSMKINNTFDWLVVPSGDIPSGNYIGILKNSDKLLGTVKFVIAK